MNSQLMETTKSVVALAPAADAAGRNGAWVDLSKAQAALIEVLITQGNAATVALTFEQAQDVSGTGAKALSGNLKIWANQDVATNDTLVAAADAKTFTTSAALKNKQVIFKAIPDRVLDKNNGFKYIRVITGASNAANITAGTYVLDQIIYGGDAQTRPTVVA